VQRLLDLIQACVPGALTVCQVGTSQGHSARSRGPSGNRVGIPIYGFRSSIPCPLMPLSTLRRQPRDCLRKTRGQAVR
jgi:hypothetical protein